MKDAMKTLISCVLLAAAGYLVVWLPWMLAGAHKNMIDGMRLESLALLVLLGAVAGRMLALRSAVIALSTVAAFPVLAVVEGIRHPGTHNLLGLEIVMYGFLAIPTFIGAFVSRLTFKSRPGDRDPRA